MFNIKSFFVMLAALFILSACDSEDTNPPTNDPPSIDSYSVSPTSGRAPLEITIAWQVSDPENDAFSCVLKIEKGIVGGEEVIKQTLNPCDDGNKTHTFSEAGSYSILFGTSTNGGQSFSSFQSKSVNVQ